MVENVRRVKLHTQKKKKNHANISILENEESPESSSSEWEKNNWEGKESLPVLEQRAEPQ